MFILGLTGGIATGKSTVSRMIAELGIPVIDADLIAREVVLPNTPGYNRVVKQFHHPPEQNILAEDGTLDRAQLGKLIFSDPTRRQQLNNILHPLIRRRMAWLAAYHYFTLQPLIVLDVPLLFEAKLDRFTSQSAVVDCSEATQEARLTSRDKCDVAAARQRIAAQMDMATKRSRADIIIDNSGDLDSLRAQVHSLLPALRPSRFVTLFRLIVPTTLLLLLLHRVTRFLLTYLLPHIL